MNGIQRSNDGMSLDKDCSQGSEVTDTSPLLLCRSLKVLPKTLKKIGTFLKTLQPWFFSKLKFSKNIASTGRLNLLISQPKSYLQDNLIHVFRWWGRRQRSEQEKQQGGGVGGEREKEPLPLSLSFYIFVPLSYLSRTSLSERL